MTPKRLLRGITGNFFLEFQVKSRLFSHFTHDAHDWVKLYHASLNCDTETLSIKTKQFMNLRMALECTLKAILIGLSKQSETARDAYKSALNCRHNLEKLVNQCKARAGNSYRICTRATLKRLQRINRLGIGIRYDVDMKTAYKQQTLAEVYSGEGPVSGVVVSDEFHKQVRHDIASLMAHARRIREKRLAKHSGGILSDMIKVEDYIRVILA
jgi:hypothetical protein